MSSKFLLPLLLAGASVGDLRAAESAVTAPPPFAGTLQWTASDVLVGPASDARGIESVKAPSIVRYNDRWHIYATTANTPEIREAQLLTLQRTKNTAMAVTIDCGDANDIHPKHKQPVGARLALAARALAYGETIEYSGPIFTSMTMDGTNAVLHFSHLGDGLVAKGGELRGFVLAGVDGVFHPAQAVVVGDTVVVNSTKVARPTAVRYGWANVPEGNLFNRAGLPATPFRTGVN